MKNTKRLAVATAASASVIGITAPAALAANFYYGPTKCYVGNGLYAQVTAYDSNSGTDKTYHHAEISNGVDGYYRYRVRYDGQDWPGPYTFSGAKGHSGSVADGYQVFDSTSATHVVTFVWKRSSGATTSCWVKM
jgi:hypothetical protein